MGSCFKRLPSIESLLPCNQFLRIGQLELCRQNVLIRERMEPGHVGPNNGSDRIISLTVPSQVLLGLFPEVFEVRHRRKLKSCTVGGRCPLVLHDAPYAAIPDWLAPGHVVKPKLCFAKREAGDAIAPVCDGLRQQGADDSLERTARSFGCMAQML